MGVVVCVWVLVRVRVPAWMPVAAHHGIRWLYGRSGAAVSGLEERAVKRKAVGGTRRQSHGRV